MRASNYHLNTLKEAPAEAEVASHQLMTRAGMIRKLAGGIYSYMPLGLKVIRKIEHIVRSEMNDAGCGSAPSSAALGPIAGVAGGTTEFLVGSAVNLAAVVGLGVRRR